MQGRVFEDAARLLGGQLHRALDLSDDFELGHLELAQQEWNASMVPTIGLPPVVTLELHTALVGDHLSALAQAPVVDRGLELLRVRLLQATPAIGRRGGIAGMKRAKLRQNPGRLPPRDLENTCSLAVEGQAFRRAAEKGQQLQMPG